MPDPYVDLVGELQPGQEGWLPLDEAGSPSGPATLSPPPGPNAKACSVKRNSVENVDAGQDSLTTPTGAPLSPPLQSNVDRRFPNDPANPPQAIPPSITALTPSTGPAGVDLSLGIEGIEFDGATGVDVSGTNLTPSSVTGTHIDVVVPAAQMVEGTVDVMVVTPAGASPTSPLTVTAPVGRDSRRRG
jgi:hypothetical protein